MAKKPSQTKAAQAAREKRATAKAEKSGGAPAGTVSTKLARTGGGFKVRATAMGYYDNERRREGDVFTIQHGGEFSSKWMERVGAGTPEQRTTGQESINRQHDELLSGKLADKATGGANPLGAE